MPRVPRQDEDRRRPQGVVPPSRQGPQPSGGHGSVQGPLASDQAEAFPRRVRLRASGEFRRVQSTGRRVRLTHIMAIYAPGTGQISRFGMAVSRKVGMSVVRNRVKRWLREAIRRHRAELAGCWDVVLVAHPSAARAGAEVLAGEFVRALARIGGARS